VTRRAARLVVMMIRPPVAVVIYLFAALGVAQAGRTDAFHPLFTVIPVILAGWFVHATVLNDLGDEAIDRVNLPMADGRPLVSGVATRAELARLGRVAAAVALVTSWAVDWRVASVVAGGLLLNAAYSRRPLRLSDRGALASFLLPAGYVALPYLVGVLAVRPSLSGEDLVLLAGLSVAFVGRILLKDFRDVRGDAMFGKRTFLVRHGRVATCVLSGACWVAGAATVLVLFPSDGLLIAVFAVYVACALHGLRRLARTSGLVPEQVVIGAIAQAGRDMGVTLLAHLTMVAKGWPSSAQAAVLVVLGMLYAGMYVTTLAQRERVTAIRPY
jgi:4-hydroxybenzoate polyprenyltransferase